MWRSGADGNDGQEADARSSDRRLASWPEMEERNVECLMNKSSEHDVPRQTKKRLKLTLCRLLFILGNLADLVPFPSIPFNAFVFQVDGGPDLPTGGPTP